jgi:poly(A) polymerase
VSALELEPVVVTARAALRGAPRAWLVGGTLRDSLLGRRLRDVDLAVEGDPEPAARAVARAAHGSAFRLSERFGAWRVVERGDVVYDLSPLAGETIEADLARRDFTVNAMARELTAGKAPLGALLDPFGGRADLERRTLRVLGPHAYADDPLRPLRLARLAAELGFAPDPETRRLTAAAAARVPSASPERVFAELRRLIVAPGVLEGLALADGAGLLAAVLPEVAALHGVEQSDYHHLDVYGHTLEVVAQQVALEGRLEELFERLAPRLRAVLDERLADELSRGEALRLGALLHDVGKPATRGRRPDGRVTFIGHDAVGGELVRALCRRLRASERLAAYLEGLTRHHLRVGFMVHERPLARAEVYRYLRATSPVEVEVTLLSCADRLATRGRGAERAIAAHLELARELMAEALDWRARGPPRPPLRGDELARALGMAPGRELGRLLDELACATFSGEVATHDEAVELARRLRDKPRR